jgi:hypothetical protein
MAKCSITGCTFEAVPLSKFCSAHRFKGPKESTIHIHRTLGRAMGKKKGKKKASKKK